MKSNVQLSPNEWQLLSAFLDDQLNTKEKRQVEELLQRDPDAREALDAFRHTRTLLKALPVRKAPRNFTLSPEMARNPILPTFTGILRYSSALAGLLLVAALALDFLSLSAPMPASQAVEEAAPEMMAMEAPADERSEAFSAEAVPSEEMSESALEPPMIIYWGAPPPVMGYYGKGGGGGAEGYIPEVDMPAVPAPLSEEMFPREVEGAPPVEETLPAPEPLRESEPILGVQLPDDRTMVFTPQIQETPLARSLPPVSLRLVQIILAALFVLTAIPAWFPRRK